VLTGYQLPRALSLEAGSTCSISGLTFSGFSAADYANGAAISNAGSLHVTDCAFLNNSTRGFGGAIYNQGDLAIEGSTFATNLAGQADGSPAFGGGGGGGAGLGGALFTTNGHLSVSHCVFLENSALGGNLSPFFGPLGLGGRGGGLNGGAGGDTNGQPNGLPGGYGGGGGGGSDCFAGGAGGFGGGAGQGGMHMLCTPAAGAAGLFGGRGGGGAGIGGAIFMDSGLLEVIDCTLASNRVVGGNEGGSALGGALYIGGGTVLVTNSTIIGNQLETGEGGTYELGHFGLPAGDALGAGIYVHRGVVAVANSTLAGNSLKSGDGGSGSRGAGDAGRAAGAGLYVEGGGVSGINVTVSSNQAEAGNNGVDGRSGWGVAWGGSASGAGVCVWTGVVSLVNSTLTLNQAVGGLGIPRGYRTWDLRGGGCGGLVNGRGTVRLLNTIIANNGARWTSNSVQDAGGSLLSDGFNLVGDTNGATGFLSNDLVNAWPSLGPLQFNGGPTLTHALMPGSSAIDAGTAVGAPLTDQRGFPRPAGRGYDIGAYEYRSAYETIQSIDGKALVLFVTEPNLSYQVQAASDLFDWQTIATAPASTNGQFLLQEPLQPLPSFYRAALPP
jgi:predicted outer membrane repeat protein